MKSNKAEKIGEIITIVILIVIIIASNSVSGKNFFVETGISRIFMPIQNGFVYVKNKVSGKNQEISDIQTLKTENQSLKDENEKLKEQSRELEVIKAENNTLKDYLNLKNKYTDYTTVAGYVIEKNFSNYDKTIVINVGKDDGVNENMPVISESGLVGHVISVTSSTAKVQTIIDTASTISGSISSSNDSIILKGTLSNNKTLRGSSIQTDATILQGDEVVTSGLGGIYPKGILVGTIQEIINTKNPIDRYANVTTATDFGKLETVLVITK